jgi:hypothetical protein
MQSHDDPHDLFEECYEALRDPQRDTFPTHTDTICGALGLLVLVLMLLIATGTLPLYDWPS